jgi:CBS domain-containing protein
VSIESYLNELKIRHLPLRQPAMVERSTSVRDTIEAMKAKWLGCALICDQGRLVGLFTERDLLNRIVGEPINYSASVEQFMTLDPAGLSLDDTVAEAMRLMYDGDYRTIPLVDGHGKAAGVVTVHDLISYFAEHFPKEALNLPPDTGKLIMQAEGA